MATSKTECSCGIKKETSRKDNRVYSAKLYKIFITRVRLDRVESQGLIS